MLTGAVQRCKILRPWTYLPTYSVCSANLEEQQVTKHTFSTWKRPLFQPITSAYAGLYVHTSSDRTMDSAAQAKRVLAMDKLLNTIAEQQGFQNFQLKTTPISTNGANFLGDIYLTDVVETGKETLKLFIKMTNTPEEARAMMQVNTVYKHEVFMYTTLAPTFHALQERHDVPEHERFKFPKYYGCNLNEFEEMIVLENLQAQGYVLHDRMTPMNWEFAKAAVEEIAKFHALSFALEKEDPKLFDKLIKKKSDGLGTEFFKVPADAMVGMLPTNIALVEPEHRSKVEKFFDEHKSKFWYKQFEPISKYSVLAHGDYRMSNILIKYQDSVLASLRPVDYGTTFYGCPLNDVLYLLFCGTDEKFRRLHYDDFIEVYYGSLSRYLMLLSHDIADVYPKSVFHSELKEKLIFGLDTAVSVLSIVFLDPSSGMKVEDFAGDGATTQLPVDGRYVDRLNGVIRDLVRWGLLK